jgi:hypothetical protein
MTSYVESLAPKAIFIPGAIVPSTTRMLGIAPR